MAIYVEKSGTVEASQYTSGKSSVLSAKAFNDHYPDEDGKRLCSRCGHALSLHGVEARTDGYGTICPNSWKISRDDGTVEYIGEKEFSSKYELLK